MREGAEAQHERTPTLNSWLWRKRRNELTSIRCSTTANTARGETSKKPSEAEGGNQHTFADFVEHVHEFGGQHLKGGEQSRGPDAKVHRRQAARVAEFGRALLLLTAATALQ